MNSLVSYRVLSCFLWIVFLIQLPVGLNAQVLFDLDEAEVIPDRTTDQRLPNTQFTWDQNRLPSQQLRMQTDSVVTYRLSESTPPFTGIAVGWDVSGHRPLSGLFQLRIRSRVSGENWGDWVPTTGYLQPEDSPSGLYWAMLYVTPDGSAHEEFEIRLDAPPGVTLNRLKITAADARYEYEKDDPEKGKILDSVDPEMPEIISRAGWWGSLPPEKLEPDYIPQQIDITHSMVHHTVTANEHPDPTQVVRQIWDWHVNDNGWLDIGYNFLIDHLGNIYQGRYNPWIEQTDVRGAHAGRANSSSVGLALLGQFEPGANPQFGDPAMAALDALVRMISWRFTQKGIDPLGSATIPVNPDGTAMLSAVTGHRDVSATACPGENLYLLLPDIRRSVETGEPVEEELAAPFELQQNFPNPFNTQTMIRFNLEEEENVWLDLYTVRGQHVRHIFRDRLEPGEYDIPFDPAGLSSGVYFYRLASDGFQQMKAMVYVR